jgi:hypothetical protein
MVMSLAVITTLIEMFWCTTHFKRVSYCMSDSWYNLQKSTHSDSESELHWCTMMMSSHLIQCDTFLYKQNIHIEQQEWPLSEKVSVLSELLLINKENWININSHKNKNNNICIVKNEGSVSCQLQDTYLYDTYIVVVVVVAAELVVWESVLTYSIKKDFTYKSCEWRSWRRKKKKLYVRWEVYNSLHWQISSSELLEKITQAMKNFHLQTLLYKAGKHVSTDIDNHTTTFSET